MNDEEQVEIRSYHDEKRLKIDSEIGNILAMRERPKQPVKAEGQHVCSLISKSGGNSYCLTL